MMSTFPDPMKNSQVSLAATSQTESATNLLRPHMWFPKARSMRRKIICHMGPTNSGKTFRAIEKLKAADSGVFAVVVAFDDRPS